MRTETIVAASNLLDLVEGDTEEVLAMMLAIYYQRRRDAANDLMASQRVPRRALEIAQAQRVVA